MIKHVLFDFDGTIADTSEGIVKCMHYAFDALGIDRTTDEAIRRIIGPPLEEMFQELLSTDDRRRIDRSVKLFRERYANEGIREMALYDDMRGVLYELAEKGLQLYIATSKPERFVREICEEHELDKLFVDISGVTVSGKSKSKSLRIGDLKEKYSMLSDEAVMVGDRAEDVEAAKNNGLECIGVLYGFGAKRDLNKAGCRYYAASATELVERIEELSVYRALGEDYEMGNRRSCKRAD